MDLTRASGSILYDRNKEAPDQQRVVWCHRCVQTKWGDAGVYRRQDGGGARLTGVMRCGSVWVCPTCSMPVSEKRREELQAGMVRWVEGGGQVYLMTLTFPHERRDNLADLMKRLEKATARFRTHRAYRGTRDTFGIIGAVRGLEATWGRANGWHPHVHFLLFGQGGLLDDPRTIDKLKGGWLDCLTKAGLLPAEKVTWAYQHALDIRGGEKAADYIAKFGRDEAWGASSEMTRHQAKIGARGLLADFEDHVTPFQVLDWAAKGDATAVALWSEFGSVFHGKRQLVYSPKLKKNPRHRRPER